MFYDKILSSRNRGKGKGLTYISQALMIEKANLFLIYRIIYSTLKSYNSSQESEYNDFLYKILAVFT